MSTDDRSATGVGGMATKLDAAEIARSRWGSRGHAALGRSRASCLSGSGPRAARRSARASRAPRDDRLACSRKRWIAHAIRRCAGPSSSMTAHAGRWSSAGRACCPRGRRRWSASRPGAGSAPGAAVDVRDACGPRVFARGLVSYASDEIARIAGSVPRRSRACWATRLCDEVIHRDNLIVKLDARARTTGDPGRDVHRAVGAHRGRRGRAARRSGRVAYRGASLPPRRRTRAADLADAIEQRGGGDPRGERGRTWTRRARRAVRRQAAPARAHRARHQAQLADGVRQIAAMPDPVNARARPVRCPAGWTSSGAHAARRDRDDLRGPPGVTVDAFALCFKAGNACLLKGGREANASERGARVAGARRAAPARACRRTRSRW
jgi:hypothetical protein